jgi:hypothetical protein
MILFRLEPPLLRWVQTESEELKFMVAEAHFYTMISDRPSNPPIRASNKEAQHYTMTRRHRLSGGRSRILPQ